MSGLRQQFLRLLYRVYRFVRWRILGARTVGVRIVLLRDDTVILVRHSYLPGWMLPGGGIKRRESVQDAAIREAREEVGAIVTGAVHLLGIYANFGDGSSDHVVLLVCEEFTVDESVRTWEIEEWRYHPIASLPKETRRLSERIEAYRRGVRGETGKW